MNNFPPPPPPLMRSNEFTQLGVRNVSFTLRQDNHNICYIEVYRNNDDTAAEYPLHRTMATFNIINRNNIPTGLNNITVNGAVDGQPVRIEFNHMVFNITPIRKGSKPKSIRNRSKSIEMANKIKTKKTKTNKTKTNKTKSKSRSRSRRNNIALTNPLIRQ